MSETTRLEHRPVADLVPDARNARTHSPEQVSTIVGSITEFGFNDPVEILPDGRIVAGHGRVLAAQRMGMDTVPCVVLDHLDADDIRRRAYAIASNRTAELSDWDADMLAINVEALREADFDVDLTGFDDETLEALLPDDPDDSGGDEDEVPEPPAEVRSATGDVWLLGAHRVVCSDCGEREIYVLALKGLAVQTLVTSPPYNVRLDAMQGKSEWGNKISAMSYADSMDEDVYQDWQRSLLHIWHDVLGEACSVFYNHKNRAVAKKVLSPLSWLPGPFSLRQEIIWNRASSINQNARMFAPSDERIYWLYKGDDFVFNDTSEIKNWTSVWGITPNPDESHPASFPVDLPRRAILATTKKGDVVLDPFCGSGTTIIACEQLNRRGVGIEQSPQFTDVTVMRWQKLTGRQAIRERDGARFDDLAPAELVA